MIVSDFRPI